MPATAMEVSAVLRAMGVPRVFIGTPFTASGLQPLATQGRVTMSAPQDMNVLTAPEFTGALPHDAWITPGETRVTVPVINHPDNWAILSAHGSAHEGFSGPQRPTFTSLAVIPLAAMDTSVDPPTIAYDGIAWDPAAPEGSAWFWRVVPIRPEMGWQFEDGGRDIVNVEFRVFYAGDEGDYAGIPNGQKAFTLGDPVAAGVTGLAI